MKKLVLSLGFVAGAVVAGCSGNANHDDYVGLGDTGSLPVRTSSVIADGCDLDTWQLSTLATGSAKQVLAGGDVILLCLVPREDGTVGPRDQSAQTALATLTQQLHNDGYHVRLAVSFTDETGERFDGEQTALWLADPDWRTQFLATIGQASQSADGIELDIEQLPGNATSNVTTLVKALSAQLRPAKTLGIFMPPSVTYPSDLPDGASFSVKDLAPYVDRMRVMTLDYSVGTAGPTIDPGWAVDATRLALADFPRVDISYPLYGTDFGPRGPRLTTYDEAIATAVENHTSIGRGPTGAPFVVWTGLQGEKHQIWFDDAQSTTTALAAWAPPTLPLSVGVVFYGLGAEDPALWEQLRARMP